MKKFIIFTILFFYIALNSLIINIPEDYSTISQGINVATNGDTILVHSGRYFEHIDYSGKNITIASLYLTTQDSSYILNTIIDGSQSFRGITFENREDSTAVLCGFTITNCNNPYGAGIYIFDHSSPTIKNCILKNNSSESGSIIYTNYSSSRFINCILKNNSGGSAFFSSNNSDINLENCVIENNYGAQRGGAIYLYGSVLTAFNCIISNNSATYFGGGIFSSSSQLHLENTLISGNSTYYKGGGFHSENNSNTNIISCNFTNNHSQYYSGAINCETSSISIINSIIFNNSADRRYGGIGLFDSHNNTISNTVIKNNIGSQQAGGLYLTSSDLQLSSVLIKENSAETGGGIYIKNSNITFDENNRCNIYNNRIFNRGSGKEIFCNTNINLVVDTFTVINPSDYYTAPQENFSFDILHSVNENLINADLYVSQYGNNNNSGLSFSEPLKTLSYALQRIYTDSDNVHTIHLASGTYSFISTLENFPICLISNIIISGDSLQKPILDANYTANIFQGSYCSNIKLSNLILKRGAFSAGGAISFSNSNMIIENCDFLDNNSGYGGAISLSSSNSIVANCTFINNFSYQSGGAVDNTFSEDLFINCLFAYNSSQKGGGIHTYSSNSDIVNCTFANNTSDQGGAIFAESNSTANIYNSILYYDSPQEMYFSGGNTFCTFSVSFSNIQGGYQGIIQEGNVQANGYEESINEDPLFQSPQDTLYSLQQYSPCIDSGNTYLDINYFPATDLAGNPRISNYLIDMGAYEFQSTYANDSQNNFDDFVSYQNIPNPFNPTTKISFFIKNTSDVKINIYNLKGELIKNFILNNLVSGKHFVIWNGKDKKNNIANSGIYFYKIIVNGKVKDIRKMTLLK